MEHFRGIFCPVMVAISSGSDINVLEHKQVQNDQQSNYCEFFKEWREVKKIHRFAFTKLVFAMYNRKFLSLG